MILPFRGDPCDGCWEQFRSVDLTDLDVLVFRQEVQGSNHAEKCSVCTSSCNLQQHGVLTIGDYRLDCCLLEYQARICLRWRAAVGDNHIAGLVKICVTVELGISTNPCSHRICGHNAGKKNRNSTFCCHECSGRRYVTLVGLDVLNDGPPTLRQRARLLHRVQRRKLPTSQAGLRSTCHLPDP